MRAATGARHGGCMEDLGTLGTGLVCQRGEPSGEGGGMLPWVRGMAAASGMDGSPEGLKGQACTPVPA